MQTVTLSTKGQLVIPRPVRDALRLEAGALLRVRVEGSRIVIERASPAMPGAWKPLNPAGARLSAQALCRPVELPSDTRVR